jgi:hypothetical protein
MATCGLEWEGFLHTQSFGSPCRHLSFWDLIESENHSVAVEWGPFMQPFTRNRANPSQSS